MVLESGIVALPPGYLQSDSARLLPGQFFPQ
jgi:hypothetical protein